VAIIWLAILLVPWVLVTLVVVTLLRTGRRSGGAITVPAALAAQAAGMRGRANQRAWIAACGAGAVGAVALVVALAFEWGLQAVAPAALAAAGVASLVIGVIGPPTAAPGAIRSAELTPRTSRGFGPRWAFVIPTGLAFCLILVVVVTGMSSSTSPDGPRAALRWSSPDGLSGYVRPYPGWDTALPLLLVLALASAGFLFALHRVAAWPRPTEPDLFDFDDEVRRTSTRMLLFGTSGALIAALGSLVLVIAGAWNTATGILRFNRETAVPILNTPHEVGYMTSESALEKALGLVAIAAATSVLVGVTIMAAALVAGWVRTPQLVAEPVVHR
jgi:hypothetical protein